MEVSLNAKKNQIQSEKRERNTTKNKQHRYTHRENEVGYFFGICLTNKVLLVAFLCVHAAK